MNDLSLVLLHSLNKVEDSKFLNIDQPTLLITAHPDDETLFFAPFILSSNVSNIYLLCMTGGNSQRFVELHKSVKHFKINILPVQTLIDGAEWDLKHVASLINLYINSYNFKQVVSFDQYGVSKHINHISIYNSIQYTIHNMKNRTIEVYQLITIPSIYKYLSSFGYIIYHFLQRHSKNDTYLFINSKEQYQMTTQSFDFHQSQNTWYRQLHLIFSSYMLVNRLEKVSTVNFLK